MSGFGAKPMLCHLYEKTRTREPKMASRDCGRILLLIKECEGRGKIGMGKDICPVESM